MGMSEHIVSGGQNGSDAWKCHRPRRERAAHVESVRNEIASPLQSLANRTRQSIRGIRTNMTAAAKDFRVMTSGAFTAAHLALIPQVERLTGKKVVTVTTSIGTGDASIPNRLKRGEIAD